MIDVERENRVEQGRALPVCMVVGNKCDLQGQRQVSAKEGLEWCKNRAFGFMETSAREMVNIEETFARKWRKLRSSRAHLICKDADSEPQSSCAA